MKAHFDRVVAVSFAFPREILRPLLPSGLELDEFEGMGFVTVAMVWTKGLRPALFPRVLGNDFFLAGYRIFTRLNNGERRLRGLKIIRSETDKAKMVLLGNLMTGYNYRQVEVKIADAEDYTEVVTHFIGGEKTLDIKFSSSIGDVDLPAGSPFGSWRQARQFAGPMPFTFSPLGNDQFIVVEGSRETWKPKPVIIDRFEVSLFNEEPFNRVKPILANAFEVRNVEYRWERGRKIIAVRE